MPDVTVVIPTHNRAALLSSTLRSVLWQTSVSFDVIVVDDGSPGDATAEVVSGLRDPRVTLLRNAHSQGVSAARNRGIEAATSPWIAFLDDDDLWAPDKLRGQLDGAFPQQRGWGTTGVVAVDDELRVVGGGPLPKADVIAQQLPVRNLVLAGSSTVVVNADLLRRVGMFDTSLRHTPDWDLWIRLGQASRPAIVDRPLVAYRFHAGNASYDGASFANELDIIDERYRSLRRGASIDRAYLLRYIAWSALRAGRPRDAIRYYGRAVLAGDAMSIGRMGVALLYPGVARRSWRRHRPDGKWVSDAEEWLLHARA